MKRAVHAWGKPSGPARPGRERARRAGILFATLAVLVLTGCSAGAFRSPPPQPGRTTLAAPRVELPAQVVGNLLVVEAKWDRFGPYRFLVDTGSSVTLVSPALARRYPGRAAGPGTANPLRVRGAEGSVVELPRATLRRLELGEARFEDVDVLLYDCAPLSAHLGIPIDGILGFPLFRETLLTLDYPGQRVILRPAEVETPVPGSVVPFDDARKVPLISLKLGTRTLMALIDSGSDAAFSLNPAGLNPRFAHGPKPGAVVGTIAGERAQRVARLDDTLALGDQVFTNPLIDFTDELTAVGGGCLRYFSVTFDQRRDRVILQRPELGPITMPALRSAGVSFTKTPAYWRVAGVVPGSPAEAARIERGDLIIRINGEPMAKWDLRRFEQVMAETDEVTFTFLQGTQETERRVRVFELVP